MSKNYHCVLGSSSPRRQELLGLLLKSFSIMRPDVDESIGLAEDPRIYVRRVAEAKAEVLSFELRKRSEAQCLLVADTIVVLGGDILGKPKDAADAFSMLAKLSGRTHEVLTQVGIRLFNPTASQNEVERFFSVQTQVKFRELSQTEIEAYIATGEPFDKAGSYGAQGRAQSFVKGIVGSYTGVVGLPLAEVYEHLVDLGVLG